MIYIDTVFEENKINTKEENILNSRKYFYHFKEDIRWLSAKCHQKSFDKFPSKIP